MQVTLSPLTIYPDSSQDMKIKTNQITSDHKVFVWNIAGKIFFIAN